MTQRPERPPPAKIRTECLPEQMRGRFGTGALALLAGCYHRMGLAWIEARCLASGLWQAGDDLTHAISKASIAKQLRGSRREVQRAFSAMAEGGLLVVRPRGIRQPKHRHKKGGRKCVGYWWPRYENMPTAVEAYLDSVSRKARSAAATLRIFTMRGQEPKVQGPEGPLLAAAGAKGHVVPSSKGTRGASKGTRTPHCQRDTYPPLLPVLTCRRAKGHVVHRAKGHVVHAQKT